jgi:hypothetical protein
MDEDIYGSHPTGICKPIRPEPATEQQTRLAFTPVKWHMMRLRLLAFIIPSYENSYETKED